MYAISSVERDTGITRERLRMWEKRYGFPNPGRNDFGERIYQEDQVKILFLIKQLLDAGFRPGQIVGKNNEELQSRLNSIRESDSLDNGKEYEQLKPLVQLSFKGDSTLFQQQLDQFLLSKGINSLIIDVVSPLLLLTGNMWANSQIHIYNEHFISRQVIIFLDRLLMKINGGQSAKNVLITSLPTEPHFISLLMIECLLKNIGYNTINLGTELPTSQIIKALDNYQADALILSFSSSYKSSALKKDLVHLVESMSEPIPIWIGGSGLFPMKGLPENIHLKKSINEIIDFKIE